MKAAVRTMPLHILEIVILHQIPFSPSGVEIRSRAIGIRATVREVLTMDGMKSDGNLFMFLLTALFRLPVVT